MTTRTITVELPSEPAPDSVILVELTNLYHVGDEVAIYRRAFQRLQDGLRTAWHMVGGEFNRPGLSWPEVIAHADGRPILVLWDPTEATS